MLLLLEEVAVAFLAWLLPVAFLLAAFVVVAVAIVVVLFSEPLAFVAASLVLFLFLFGLARYLLTRPVSLFLSRQSSAEACVFVAICCPAASVVVEDPVNPVRLF